MKLIVIFIIFGFLFGLFSKVDSTGGEVPYSMMLNVPTLYVQEVISMAFSRIEEARIQRLREKLGITNQELSVTGDEFEGLSFNEKRERISSEMIREKDLQRNDSIVGEKGALQFLKSLISFPILSAFTWGLIGFVVYVIVFVKKKLSNVNAG